MGEIRYIQIDSCNRCEHNGHAHGARTTEIVHVCGNPLTSIAIKPRHKIAGVDYPITSTTTSIKSAPIPLWCPLLRDILITFTSKALQDEIDRRDNEREIDIQARYDAEMGSDADEIQEALQDGIEAESAQR